MAAMTKSSLGYEFLPKGRSRRSGSGRAMVFIVLRRVKVVVVTATFFSSFSSPFSSSLSSARKAVLGLQGLAWSSSSPTTLISLPCRLCSRGFESRRMANGEEASVTGCDGKAKRLEVVVVTDDLITVGPLMGFGKQLLLAAVADMSLVWFGSQLLTAATKRVMPAEIPITIVPSSLPEIKVLYYSILEIMDITT